MMLVVDLAVTWSQLGVDWRCYQVTTCHQLLIGGLARSQHDICLIGGVARSQHDIG